MKTLLKLTISLLIVCGGLLALAGVVSNASSPEPTGYTLEDIYNLIQNNSATEGNHLLQPSGMVGSSMHSVSEIYVALANLIDPMKLPSDVVQYLGVAGNIPVTPVDAIEKDFAPNTEPGTITGYTLTDIANLIQNNRITSPSHSFAPASSPAPTSMSLTEIYNALSTLIDSASIATGATYLGVLGTYVVPVANPGTFYFKDVDGTHSHAWDNPSNWWVDAALTIPAGVIPESGSTIYLAGELLTGPTSPVDLDHIYS